MCIYVSLCVFLHASLCCLSLCLCSAASSYRQVDEMISTARSLSEYYRAVQDDKTNRTLYILTLVTSVFVPAQFLTGLYGTALPAFYLLSPLFCLYCAVLCNFFLVNRECFYLVVLSCTGSLCSYCYCFCYQ